MTTTSFHLLPKESLINILCNLNVTDFLSHSSDETVKVEYQRLGSMLLERIKKRNVEHNKNFRDYLHALVKTNSLPKFFHKFINQLEVVRPTFFERNSLEESDAITIKIAKVRVVYIPMHRFGNGLLIKREDFEEDEYEVGIGKSTSILERINTENIVTFGKGSGYECFKAEPSESKLRKFLEWLWCSKLLVNCKVERECLPQTFNILTYYIPDKYCQKGLFTEEEERLLAVKRKRKVGHGIY